MNKLSPPRSQMDIVIALCNSGQFNKAIEVSEKLLTLYPQSLFLLSVLGEILPKQERFADLVGVLDKIIQIEPNSAKVYCNRGVALQKLGELEEALASCDCAIRLEPNFSEAYYNRGITLSSLGRLQDALRSYDQAIKLKPQYAEAYSNRGNVLVDLGDSRQALESYDQAIKLKPQYAEAYNNRSNALKDLGRLREAIGECQKAIGMEPDYHQAHWNLSLLLLSSGDLKNGWIGYKHGQLKKRQKRRLTNAPYPIWNGSSLEGKTILVTAEQGVGDEIMFASCIPDLINLRPKKVVVECDPRLDPLFKRSFCNIDIQHRTDQRDIDWVNAVGDINFQIASGSLPLFFRNDLGDFPLRKSFLEADILLRKKWRERYNTLGNRMKVGVSWTGGAAGSKERRKSLSLEQFLPLLRMDADFVNLQYGDHSEKLEKLQKATGICLHDWPDANPLADLDNQAAQIAELDLVVSYDNATVQMSGALGKETWVLVYNPPFWLWMLERRDSPWYPAIKVYRKSIRGGWTKLMKEICNDLSSKLKLIN